MAGFFKPKTGDRVTWDHEYVYDHGGRTIYDLNRACAHDSFTVGEHLGDDVFLMVVDPYKKAERWNINFFIRVPDAGKSFARWLIEDFLCIKTPGPS